MKKHHLSNSISIGLTGGTIIGKGINYNDKVWIPPLPKIISYGVPSNKPDWDQPKLRKPKKKKK